MINAISILYGDLTLEAQPYWDEAAVLGGEWLE